MSAVPDIPDFELLFRCGCGAFGDVWIGRDRDGIKRAVKILDIERLKSLGVLHKEESGVRLFRNKAGRHHGLIDIIHSGENESYIYYIMELADNASDGDEYVPDTLSNRISEGAPLPPGECTAVISTILDAVEHLHSKGIIHRDIKPSNILFIDGVPKLADVGLVSMDCADISLAGTPGFLPPDGVSGTDADLYALGKLLYCMFTGNPPEKFPSIPESILTASDTVKNLNRTVIKACSAKSKLRFSSVEEFREYLNGNRSKEKRKVLGYAFILIIIIAIFAIVAYQVTGIISANRRGELVHFADRALAMDDIKSADESLRKLVNNFFEWAKTSEEFKALQDRLKSKKRMVDAYGGVENYRIHKEIADYRGTPKELELWEKLWRDKNTRKLPAVIAGYAECLKRFKYTEKAEDVWKLLDRKDLVTSDETILADALRERGANHHIPATGIAYITRAIELCPDNYQNYLERAELESRLAADPDQKAAAIADAKKVLELEPGNRRAKKILDTFL